MAANDNAVTMGHHLHLLVEDVQENAAFWKSLGGEPMAFANSVVIRFPNGLIFLDEQNPTDGTNGSVVNHVGVQFRELRALVKRLKIAGTPIITGEVAGATFDVDSDGLAFHEGAGAYLAFVRAPNGARVELQENKELASPMANHHIHFNNPEVDAMKAWYVTKLGAKPGQRSGMEVADIGEVNLTFSPVNQKLAGTKGRALLLRATQCFHYSCQPRYVHSRIGRADRF